MRTTWVGAPMKRETFERLLAAVERTYPGKVRMVVEVCPVAVQKTIDNEADALETIRRIEEHEASKPTPDTGDTGPMIPGQRSNLVREMLEAFTDPKRGSSFAGMSAALDVVLATLGDVRREALEEVRAKVGGLKVECGRACPINSHVPCAHDEQANATVDLIDGLLSTSPAPTQAPEGARGEEYRRGSDRVEALRAENAQLRERAEAAERERDANAADVMRLQGELAEARGQLDEP